MPNHTYVCTRCRYARRAMAAYGLNHRLRCAGCGGPLWELEYRWRIPRKNDVKGWRDLYVKVMKDLMRDLPWRYRKGAKEAERLDGLMEAVMKERESERRERKLRELRRVRENVERLYVREMPFPGWF